MRYFFLLFILLSCGNLPQGPDTSHPLYVNDPDRIYFKNIRSLSYRIIQVDPYGQTDYQLKGLPADNFPIMVSIHDNWLDSRAELSILPDPELWAATEWQLSGYQSSEWITLLSYANIDAGWQTADLRPLLQHLNSARPLRLETEDVRFRHWELTASDQGYSLFRSCLQDYFRLLNES